MTRSTSTRPTSRRSSSVASLATVGILLDRRPPGDPRRRRRSACSSASSPRSTGSSTRSASSRSSTRPTSRAWRRSTRSSSCSTSSPSWPTAPTRSSSAALRGEIRFEDVSFAYGTEDGTQARAATTSTLHVPPGQTVALVGATGAGKSTLRQARRALLRPDRRARARRRPRPARRRARARCARRWASCRRRASCSAARSRDNIALRPPGRDARRDRGRRARGRRVGLHRGAARRPRHRGRRARRAALGRPAPARRLRPRAGRRPAHPRPRRGDLERRPAHRERASRPGLRRLLAGRTAIVIAHRLSTIRQAGRIVVLDQRPDRRAGHARRAARGRAAPTRRCTATGRSRRRRDATYALRAADGGRRRADGRRDDRRASRATARSRRRAGRRRRPPTRSSAWRGCSARTTSGTSSPSTRARSSATSASCPPTGSLRADRRPGARALPPAVRGARPLGHRPGHPAARRGDRRGARPRLHGDAPVHAGRPGARAALLRARGLGADASAGASTSASASRSWSTATRCERYSSRPRRIASATAAARSLTPSFS